MRFRDGESGQSVVEFALVLPVLALVLLAIIDFGRVYSAKLTLSEAARDAARYASIGDDNSTLQQVIQQDAGSLGSSLQWSVSPDAQRNSGDTVTISVTATVPMFDPLMAAILGSQYAASSSVTMRVE